MTKLKFAQAWDWIRHEKGSRFVLGTIAVLATADFVLSLNPGFQALLMLVGMRAAIPKKEL